MAQSSPHHRMTSLHWMADPGCQEGVTQGSLLFNSLFFSSFPKHLFRDGLKGSLLWRSERLREATGCSLSNSLKKTTPALPQTPPPNINSRKPDQYFILKRNIRKSPEQGKGARLTHIIPLRVIQSTQFAQYLRDNRINFMFNIISA